MIQPTVELKKCSHSTWIGYKCVPCRSNWHKRLAGGSQTESVGCSHGHLVTAKCDLCAADFDMRGFNEPAHTDAHDPVSRPKHYTSHPSGVECIQITEHMGFNLGNALKYIWRADENGNAIEDLQKAAWYIDRELKRRGHAGEKGAPK